ncbi:TPA: hypothetical protein ACOENS_000124 [Stenotrophomonas maltophilia]
MSDDFFTRKTYRHRIEVDGTKFIVETWIKGDLRIIQNVWHCRRHRRGGTADVRIHPNGRRPPSATLAKLWDHLGVSHDALWKECPANHASFSTQRVIQTAFDVAEESTMHKAATDALLAQGWIWNVETLRWDTPPAQAVDLGALVAELAEADREYSEAKKKYYTVSAKSSAAGGRAACSAAYQREVTAKARLDAAVRALIDSQAVGK